jgi:membrane protease YdiL (CAAX protease family)
VPDELGQLLFEAVVRVSLGTALAEEVLFRGVLLGIWEKDRGRREGVIWSSVAFGLWHVGPSIQNQCPGTELSVILMAVAGSIAITTLLGFFLPWLRHRTGGVLAPVIAHAAVNGSLVVAGYAAVD